MRNLGAVLDHEEPLTHPVCDQAPVGNKRRVDDLAEAIAVQLGAIR
jgi:hypothetical protein